MTTILEGVDAAADTATQYSMAAGDEFWGRLDQGTSDWIAVTLTAGVTYSFGAVGLGALGTGVTDPILRLRDAGGASIAQNDDGGPGLSASLTFTATTSGVYHVEVKALTAAPDGEYGLAMTAGDRPSYGTELGAAILYRPGKSWADTPETATVVTWGVRDHGPAVDASGVAAPFATLSTAQIAAAEVALGNFSDVANLSFQQVNPGGTTQDATILLGAYVSTSDGAGAYANYPGSTASGKVAGDLWLNNQHVSQTDLPFGSYDLYVVLHELGHAMGLAHPGDYNAAPGVSITYDTSAQFVEDSIQYSVMSYFDAVATEPDAPASYADTLMLYDIYAVQQLYGVNTATRAGNDTYGFKATVGGAYDFTVNTDPLLCIWDGAGRDTLNLSGFGSPQVIDLRDGHFSSVGGFTDNLSIAVGAAIENAVGGRGADSMIGNALKNHLSGGKGADTIAGGAGNDSLTGNLGADHFLFGADDGRDRITDFGAADLVSLRADLWGGALMTGAEVIDAFAVLRGGHVVLDFGANELSFLGLASAAGLESHILLA